MTDSPSWGPAIVSAPAMMPEPVPLLPLLSALNGGTPVETQDLERYLERAGANSPGIPQLHTALARWDADTSSTMAGAPPPDTPERRSYVYDRLDLSGGCRSALDRLCPPNLYREVVISTEFQPWYENRPLGHTLYWDDYRRYLTEEKEWTGKPLIDLERSTFEIVRRLTDPTRSEVKQTKGLVVGYVQSGKTANFTGVVARAIDAGYRLVIILTGTIELLRAQTQRRLDMELVGRENILAGRPEKSEDDHKLDYRQDEDWIKHRFVEHGAALDTGQDPAIMRVTTHQSDYKRLPDEVSKLKFKRIDKTRPLNDPANLAAVDAYVAVVKKNNAPLKKLIEDLQPLRDTLDELPVLIIDDESDQASVDTTNPKKKTDKTERERTAINEKIGQILQLCKRAQYVGYTATPFANVFINPDDNTDLFPSDFLISLPRPEGYMGVQEFHDVGKRWDDDEKSVATSNECAHVRGLEGDGADSEQTARQLRTAVDAFVLSGAVKKYREQHSDRRFRHHTMIIHESMFTQDAGAAAVVVRRLWREAQFTQAAGLGRLRTLYENDFAPVSAVRGEGEARPRSFDDLKPFIGAAIAQITDGGEEAFLIVNSDKELTAGQQKLDFQAHPVWKILIGGTQLSRGFTVEGLTISYYRRKTGQADTLMQAGRWFGFRPGYSDLVRLYIRRDQEVDLYAAFEALLQDEEDFRAELKRYAGWDEQGKPVLEPRAIPPLVTQRLPWLTPTARNKMWNAEIVERGGLGGVDDLTGVPPLRTEGSAGNFTSVAVPLLQILTEAPAWSLRYRRTEGGDRVSEGTFTAKVGRIAAPEFLELLDRMHWSDRHSPSYAKTIRYLRRITEEGLLTEWGVMWPQTARGTRTRATSEHLVDPIEVITRNRREDREQFTGSDRKHANTLSAIAAGAQGGLGRSHTRGAVLLTLAVDRTAVAHKGEVDADEGGVATLMSLYLPDTPDLVRSGPLRWTVSHG